MFYVNLARTLFAQRLAIHPFPRQLRLRRFHHYAHLLLRCHARLGKRSRDCRVD